MATPEKPKEGQGENYETIKLILEDAKKMGLDLKKAMLDIEDLKIRVIDLEKEMW